MLAVGLKQLKNKLSEYVRQVANGETVLVTDREKVVAELIPPRSERGSHVQDAMLANMVHQGILTAPLRKDPSPPPRQPLFEFETLMNELRQDRDTR